VSTVPHVGGRRRVDAGGPPPLSEPVGASVVRLVLLGHDRTVRAVSTSRFATVIGNVGPVGLVLIRDDGKMVAAEVKLRLLSMTGTPDTCTGWRVKWVQTSLTRSSSTPARRSTGDPTESPRRPLSARCPRRPPAVVGSRPRCHRTPTT
jgi:hypothetical protein